MSSWNKISPEQAERFAAALPKDSSLERAMMFGCPIAKVNGNMFAGVHNNEINVRLGETERARCLELKDARTFSPMKGMEMKEYVVLPPVVAKDAKLLGSWIRKGFAFASSLPPKKKKPKKAKPAVGSRKKR